MLIEEAAPASVKAKVGETDDNEQPERPRRGLVQRVLRWVPEVAVTAPFAIAVALRLRHQSKGRQAV